MYNALNVHMPHFWGHLVPHTLSLRLLRCAPPAWSHMTPCADHPHQCSPPRSVDGHIRTYDLCKGELRSDYFESRFYVVLRIGGCAQIISIRPSNLCPFNSCWPNILCSNPQFDNVTSHNPDHLHNSQSTQANKDMCNSELQTSNSKFQNITPN